MNFQGLIMILTLVASFFPLALADLNVQIQPQCKGIAYRQIQTPNMQYVLNNRGLSFDELCWSQPGKVLENGHKAVYCWCSGRTAIDRPDIQYQRFQCGSWPEMITKTIFNNQTRFPYEDPMEIASFSAEEKSKYTVVKTCYVSCTCPQKPAMSASPGAILAYDYFARPKNVIRTSYYPSSSFHAHDVDKATALAIDRKAMELTELADERLKPNCQESCSGYQGPEACASKRLYPGCETVFCRVQMRTNKLFFGVGVCQLMADSNRAPHAGANPKRSEESVSGCACNATYVSEGCCGSRDGIIWEAPEFYLGRLDGA